MGTRRSSRPAPSLADAPSEPPAPLDSAPDIAEVADAAPAPTPDTEPFPALFAAAPPADEVTEELSDDDVSPDSGEKKTSPAPDAEELGRDDAISVPPEELAAFQEAQAQAQAQQFLTLIHEMLNRGTKRRDQTLNPLPDEQVFGKVANG